MVSGVEPNEDTRKTVEADLRSSPSFWTVDGYAESTKLAEWSRFRH
jgi:hypothetical protein